MHIGSRSGSGVPSRSIEASLASTASRVDEISFVELWRSTSAKGAVQTRCVVGESAANSPMACLRRRQSNSAMAS